MRRLLTPPAAAGLSAMDTAGTLHPDRDRPGERAPTPCAGPGDGAIRFTSAILPRYLRRAKSLEDLLPWLYLKGISTGDFGEALAALLGSLIDDLRRKTRSGVGRENRWPGEMGPQLALGDGALGFWKALRQVYPGAREQRCWVHKTGNVLNKLPKGLQKKAKGRLQDNGRNQEGCRESWKPTGRIRQGRGLPGQGPRRPADVLRLPRQLEACTHESRTFATVRLRYRTKGCLSARRRWPWSSNLPVRSEKMEKTRWNHLAGIRGVKFVDGERQDRAAA